LISEKDWEISVWPVIESGALMIVLCPVLLQFSTVSLQFRHRSQIGL